MELELTALYKEYDTLRDEVITRLRTRHETLGIMFAGGTLIFLAERWWLPIPLVLGLGLLVLRLGTLISNCSRRVAEIETSINHLIRTGDAPGPDAPGPMRWETDLQRSVFNRAYRPRG